MKRAMLIAALLWMAHAGNAWSVDQIYTFTGDKPYNGKILSMTSTAITFEPLRTGPSEIPANAIKRVILDNSPRTLTAAQDAVLKGDYEKAIEALSTETPEDKRREVAEEIKFCRAYSAAELALSGAADVDDAGNQLFAFITNCPNSFHYFKACELMGDICVLRDKFADAEKYYAKLNQAPWPDFKIRAQVALGRSYLAQNKAADAEKAFDDALNNDSPGDLAETQRTAARVGKARCMILAGKTSQALQSLKEVIANSDERNVEVNALAYNAQGTALRKAGKPQEAILAFLHVHLAYNTQPDLDAEAVANLEKLFLETHKTHHAREMHDILTDKYSNSRWAKGVK